VGLENSQWLGSPLFYMCGDENILELSSAESLGVWQGKDVCLPVAVGFTESQMNLGWVGGGNIPQQNTAGSGGPSLPS
jgi:hypothetical protein